MAKPKLCLIPATIGDKVYSILPSDGVGDFDFTRASTATRINAQGLIETVASGENRLNYSLLDGKVVGCPHLLLEPQSTNLVTYSEDFSNAAWTKSNVSITSNSIVSPDGTTNASLMTITAGAADQRIQKDISYSGTNTVSIFAKASDSNWISIRIGGSVNKWYDLQNGVLGSSTITTDYVDADIQDYGNGWYRCILVFTGNFTTSTRIYPAENNLDITHTSGSVYIWGAQAESNTSYPTSYIKTTSAAVTRAAETCNGSGNASTFNDSEGVLMADISALADDLTYRGISLGDGTGNNLVRFYYENVSNRITAQIKYSGVSQATMSYTFSDTTISSKILIKYKLNDFALWVNGFEVATDLNGSTPSGLDKLSFDTGTGGDDFYGKTKQIQYFDTTDIDLEQLTSWDSFRAMAQSQLYSIQ